MGITIYEEKYPDNNVTYSKCIAFDKKCNKEPCFEPVRIDSMELKCKKYETFDCKKGR